MLENVDFLIPTRSELDLSSQSISESYISKYKPDKVVHLAAKVMGLQGNLTNQIVAFEENSKINENLFRVLLKFPPSKIFFAGTAASYGFPYRSLPLMDQDFMLGEIHQGEFGYGWAKRSAYPYLKLLKDEHGCQINYGILTNLFGPFDRFKGVQTHVIPALISRAAEVFEKKEDKLTVWGFPNTTRDFLFSNVAGDAINFLITSTFNQEPFFVNIASGVERNMSEVARTISHEFQIANINWIHDKPVGIDKRYSDISILRSLGFDPSFNFENAIHETIEWYKFNSKNSR